MPKLLFLSESCLLDRSSGAAQSVRAMLVTLAKAGWEVRAATLTCCDGGAEYPLAASHAALDPVLNAGKRVALREEGFDYELLVTRSTRPSKLRPPEIRAYLSMAERRLASFRPDIVLTYCSELLHPLLARARQMGTRTVFYVANPAVLRQPGLAMPHIDRLLAPSQFVADLGEQVLGKPAQVVGNIVPRPFAGARNLAPDRIAERKRRFVTMINPSPQKGGLFFINLAAQAAATAPDIRFRAVESRGTRAMWQQLNVDQASLDRIDWHPHTADMARIYDQAALLLVPSLWEEASGRVIAEAVLAGVPVLAMRNGGIPEQLGEGGILFDLPPALAADFLAAPPIADLLRWTQFITALMDNDDLYTRAVRLAVRESERLAPERRAEAMVAVFTGLLSAECKTARSDANRLEGGTRPLLH